MPTYTFLCNDCHAADDRFMSVAEMEANRNTQRCQRCEGTMCKLISVPAIVGTDTRFFRGHDDGLKNDQFTRNILRKRAAQLDMSISGKKYFPQLCRKGKTMDPFACCGDIAEVKQKLAILGRGAEGSINVKVPEREPEPEKPYRVAEDIVIKETRAVARQRGLKDLTPREKQVLKEEVRTRISPRKAVATL
jgi:predicted nucleic acid-binding Zn ribbon protein